MTRDEKIMQLWENAGHGTRRQDIEAAFAAGEAAERGRIRQVFIDVGDEGALRCDEAWEVVPIHGQPLRKEMI